MNLPNQKTRERQAFTLIEVMVVLVIVALLVALLAAAVYKGLAAGKRTKNRVEISQLETAMAQFYQRYGVYPPSRLMLCEQLGYYHTIPTSLSSPYLSPLAADSVAFLTKIFPNLDTSASGIWAGSNPPGGVNLDGSLAPVT